MSRCFNFILLSKNSAKGSDRRPTFLPFVEFVYIVVITIYLIWSLPDALICKVSKNFANGHYEIEEIELKATALSFNIDLKYPKDVYFIAKMPNFAHSDAEAPPSVFLYHMNKIF